MAPERCSKRRRREIIEPNASGWVTFAREKRRQPLVILSADRASDAPRGQVERSRHFFLHNAASGNSHHNFKPTTCHPEPQHNDAASGLRSAMCAGEGTAPLPNHGSNIAFPKPLNNRREEPRHDTHKASKRQRRDPRLAHPEGGRTGTPDTRGFACGWKRSRKCGYAARSR